MRGEGSKILGRVMLGVILLAAAFICGFGAALQERMFNSRYSIPAHASAYGLGVSQSLPGSFLDAASKEQRAKDTLGPSAPSSRVNDSPPAQEDSLYVTVLAVDLQRQLVVCGPTVDLASNVKVRGLSTGRVEGVMLDPGGAYDYDVKCTIKAPQDGEVADIEASLNDDGARSHASGRLKLKRRETCLLFLPDRDHPKCIFVFGCSD